MREALEVSHGNVARRRQELMHSERAGVARQPRQEVATQRRCTVCGSRGDGGWVSKGEVGECFS